MFVLDHLQIVKTRHQSTDQYQYKYTCHKQTAMDYSGVFTVVFQVDGLGHESLVVGMTIENGPGPVELFRQQNTHQRMRQGQC